MNEFESRYYPLKREFALRSEKFHRAKHPRTRKLRFPGKKLTACQFSLPAPAPGAVGKRIIYVSDWHWHDSKLNRQLLSEFIWLTKEFPADFLILGGDLCDDADCLHLLPELLGQLASLAPVTIAVNGNWEVGKRWLKPDYFAGLYAANQIKFLENSSFTCGNFRFTGLPDVSSIDFRYLPEPEKLPDTVDILLTHNPDGVVSADRKGFLRNFALALCGHTHGGQIRIPFFGALYVPSFYHRKFDRGIFERRGLNLKMAVSAGIGAHRRTFRFACPPEVFLVEFN